MYRLLIVGTLCFLLLSCRGAKDADFYQEEIENSDVLMRVYEASPSIKALPTQDVQIQADQIVQFFVQEPTGMSKTDTPLVYNFDGSSIVFVGGTSSAVQTIKATHVVDGDGAQTEIVTDIGDNGTKWRYEVSRDDGTLMPGENVYIFRGFESDTTYHEMRLTVNL